MRLMGTGGGRRNPMATLQAIMGSQGARDMLYQTVTGSEMDAINSGEALEEEEKKPGRKRTGSRKAGSSEVTKEPDPNISRTPWQAKEESDKETFSASQLNESADAGFGANAFLRGIGEAINQTEADMFFGSGFSQVGQDWGINPTSHENMYDDPYLFHELFDQNVGASPHLDAKDFAMFGRQNDLRALADPSTNSLDWIAGAAENAQTPGGSFATMGDALAWLRADTPGSEALRDYPASQINTILIDSVSKNYPGLIVNATKTMLDDAETQYQAAVATGYKGSYMEYLDEQGISAYLEGM